MKILYRMMACNCRRLLLATSIFFAVLLAPPLFGRTIGYEHEVRPILETHCFACHGEGKSGGLDMRTLTTVIAGGASGPVIVPGKPELSLLWKMVNSDKMPLGGAPLSSEQKRLLRQWIAEGTFPAAGTAHVVPSAGNISPEARRFWSFQPPVKGPVPEVHARDLISTPVDSFILRKLEERGWSFTAQANRTTLLRRVYLDVTGLPPSPAEVADFIADKSDTAWERVVDRLLASPHYGERWGRHWLDVAGYSDSVGSSADEPRLKSWQYRDYVIRALNADKPYDQFLLEQFAGDQMVNYEPGTKPKPEDVEKLVATGFLRLAPDITDNQPIYEVDKRFDALQTTMETSMKAVLGLTVGCARCHDHKFDPILQDDYYRIMAAFQPAYDPDKWIPAALSYGEWPTRFIVNADPDRRDLWQKAALAGGYELGYSGVNLRVDYANAKARLRTETGSMAEISDADIEKRLPDLARRTAELKAKQEAIATLRPDLIWALWDVSREPAPTYKLIRGNYLTPGPVVKPGILSVFDDPAHPFQFPDPKPEWHHTGRRLALAQWLTRPDHPLTARVMVNRVWQFHFGEGLVRTPDDFGTQGARPTHPELLDWLTVSFVEHGWSLKWLHRQILLSTAWRQAALEDPVKTEQDPSNRLLWRRVPERLDAETIRDSLLKVSGLLNLSAFGKFEPLKQAADGQWVEGGNGESANRRSLYLLGRRTGTDSFLLAFDEPTMDNGNASQRFRSALPSQSLGLMNNPLVFRVSDAFATSIEKHSDGNNTAALRDAFRAAWLRDAEPEELSIARRVLEKYQYSHVGWRILCQSLLGSNQFLYSF